jgi:hypothetical protein
MRPNRAYEGNFEEGLIERGGRFSKERQGQRIAWCHGAPGDLALRYDLGYAKDLFENA